MFNQRARGEISCTTDEYSDNLSLLLSTRRPASVLLAACCCCLLLCPAGLCFAGSAGCAVPSSSRGDAVGGLAAGVAADAAEDWEKGEGTRPSVRKRTYTLTSVKLQRVINSRPLNLADIPSRLLQEGDL